MRTHLGLLIVIACLASSLVGRVALADKALAKPTAPAARDHLSRGARLYNNRSFEEAIAEFKEGALVEPSPVFDYNLGQAYRQLGKYEEALWHYDRFLTNGEPTGELLDAVQRFQREMREHLANRPRTMPPTDPAPEVDQPRTPAAARQAATAPTTGGVRSEAPAPETSANWFGMGVTASGVVALGASGLLFWSASSLNDEANTEPNSLRRNDLHDRSHTRGIIGTIVGIGGVALTATGVYMLVTHRSRGAHSGVANLDLGFGRDGVVVLGRF